VAPRSGRGGRRFKLVKFESYLEIPLDSYVGRKLTLLASGEGMTLPPWDTVKRLTPELSANFQAVAGKVAKRKRTQRVHLDVFYWRGGA
jgi:hypothetical protein